MTERRRGDEIVDRLGRAPGLCGSCRHRTLIESARSVFVRCALSDHDSRLARYPSLPVLECFGYRPRDPGDDRSA